MINYIDLTNPKKPVIKNKKIYFGIKNKKYRINGELKKIRKSKFGNDIFHPSFW
jgi:hypothetical protein